MRRNKRLSKWLRVIKFGVLALFAALMPRPADAADKPQRWALLIGVNDYASVQHLRYCVADQEALAAQLVASGFPKDQVYLLDDKSEQQKFRPSKLNIEKQLELVLSMPSAGDTVVLSFSGHGVQLDGKSYLCPADCDLDHPADTMIPVDKVFDALSACKASLKLLIVDACRNDLELGGKRAIDSSKNSRGLVKSLESPPEGISLLTSCSAGQFARENEKLGHGVFMHFILEGLQGKAADDDGAVRLGRLLDYTSLNTQKYVHDEFNAAQKPYYRLEGSGPVELARIEHPRAEKIDLKAKIRKGDKRLITMSNELTTETFDGKTKQQIGHITSSFEMRIEAMSRDIKGGYTWRLGFERLRLSMDTLDGKGEFDTAHPSDELAATATAIKSVPMTLATDAKGDIKADVTAFAKALKQAGADEAFVTSFSKSFAASISSNQSVSLLAGVNPGKPLRLGDHWDDKEANKSEDTPTEVEVTYTLQDRRDGTAVLKYEGRAKTILKQIDNLELKGPVRGTIEVNESTGMITRMDIVSNLAFKKDDKSLTIRGRMNCFVE